LRIDIDAGSYSQASQMESGATCVPDAISFSESKSAGVRFAIMLTAIAAGVTAGTLFNGQMTDSLTGVFLVLTLIGGFLSTWSPCGYSSLSLLRPAGKYSFASVARWTPTFITHALGYAIGAVILGGALGLVGTLLFESLAFNHMVMGLAALAVGYGAHQLGFLKMPYPQRRAQVPHDARLRFRSSTIGLLYGYALGMNYLTYVQTPILYIVTGAALLSADVTTAITLIAVFNVGRCLPVAVNFLPVSNQSVQAWLARWQERAVELDGFLLLSVGAAALTMLTL
jgi:cytochrome c biogenesis protein CcdA